MTELRTACLKFLQNGESNFALLLTKLDALSPLAVLKRGYSIAKATSGKPISGVGDVDVGEQIYIRLADGELKAKVIEK